MACDFTDSERAVLRIVQADIPDSLTPYADIAREAGVEEAEVLALLRRLCADGAIRRFGASIKHNRTPWKFNAMVAWKAPADAAARDACGAAAARHPNISHCYYRPSSAPDWPYELYTMVHGRSREECRQVIADVRAQTALDECAVLESLQELKKISMTYF